MLLLLVGGFFATLWIAPVFAIHGGAHPEENLPEGPKTGAELLKIIDNITDWIFVIFLAVAVIIILFVAFQFLTGGGDPGKVTEARTKLIYAAVAIAVALLAGGFGLVIQNIIIGETQLVEVQIVIEKKLNHKLISLPVTPPDPKIATIISSIQDKIKAIFHYGSPGPQWYSYIPGGPSDLTTMEPGKAYLFNMKETATLIVSGVPYAFKPINLTANLYYMIGAPFGGVKLQDVIGTCSLSDITAFGDEDGAIPVNPGTRLEQGEGYWIRSQRTCTLQ